MPVPGSAAGGVSGSLRTGSIPTGAAQAAGSGSASGQLPAPTGAGGRTGAMSRSQAVSAADGRERSAVVPREGRAGERSQAVANPSAGRSTSMSVAATGAMQRPTATGSVNRSQAMAQNSATAPMAAPTAQSSAMASMRGSGSGQLAAGQSSGSQASVPLLSASVAVPESTRELQSGSSVNSVLNSSVSSVDGSEIPARVGRYHVERRLGSGGMADVYLCRQSGLGGFDRRVVIKQIRSELRDRDDVIFMFLDEARIAAQINHPNVVQIYDLGEHDGLPYLVMEYVRGLSLESLIKRLREQNLKLPIDLVAALGAQACAGLHAAHELRDGAGQSLNVIHRDISPSNLLLSVDGVVKVIDFGVARARNRLSVTSAGQLKGRAGYLAPEALTTATLDRRADLYSLGVVLYELCSGKPLFDRDSKDGPLAALTAPLITVAPLLSTVRRDAPEEMVGLLEDVLEVNPDHRPATAAEFGTRLHQVALAGGRYVTPTQITDWLRDHLPPEAWPVEPTVISSMLPPASNLPPGGSFLFSTGGYPVPSASSLNPLGPPSNPDLAMMQPTPTPISTQATQAQSLPYSSTEVAPAPAPAPSTMSPVSSQATDFQIPAAQTQLFLEVARLTQQVQLLQRMYWPLLLLFWVTSLGILMIGIYLIFRVAGRPGI